LFRSPSLICDEPGLAGGRPAAPVTIPEEVDTPPVVQAVLRWEARFREWLPGDADAEARVSQMLGDRWFYERHLPMTRARGALAADLLPRTLASEQLSPRQLLRALTDAACFDALHMRAAARA
jgi:hypothetical protein